LGQLALLAGVPKETIQLQAPPAMTAEAFQLPFESWKQQAIENRLELDIHDTNIEYIRAEIQAIKATEIPWLKHIQANYRVLNDYGDRDGAGVEIAFSLPFFTGNDGKEKAAYATLNSQQKQRFHTIKMIEVETSNLVDEFKALEQQWNNHRDAIGPMADELRESVDRMAEQNRQSTNAYWDTRIALFELESKELQMMHLYQQLLLKSKATLGTLN
jgi:outer membrane protein TolC